MDEFTQSAATEIAEQSQKAVKALKEYVEKADATKKMLFPEAGTGLSVIATLKRTALQQPHYRNFVNLPHSERTRENTSICLILPDLSREKAAKTNPDVDAESRKWVDILRKKHRKLDVKQIDKVITLNQLRREYSQAPDKKKFSNSYDIFLVEAKLLKIVLTFMGCHFRTSTKRPIAVHATKGIFLGELSRVYNKVSLPVEACKDTISVHIGNLSQPAEHLTANVNAVAEALLKFCPGGAPNLRSVYLTAENVKTPLPLYVDFGSPNDVVLSRSEKKSEVFEDECSTLPDGLAVRVFPDGRVSVMKKKKASAVKETAE